MGQKRCCGLMIFRSDRGQRKGNAAKFHLPNWTTLIKGGLVGVSEHRFAALQHGGWNDFFSFSSFSAHVLPSAANDAQNHHHPPLISHPWSSSANRNFAAFPYLTTGDRLTTATHKRKCGTNTRKAQNDNSTVAPDTATAKVGFMRPAYHECAVTADER